MHDPHGLTRDALAAAMFAYGKVRQGDAEWLLRNGFASFASDGALELTELGHYVTQIADDSNEAL
jgi:hypothetical protein